MEKKHIFDTDRILAIPISDVVAEFDSLKRKGRHKVTHCPWHDDHKPSLVLYEDKGQNHCVCFVCGKGGDIVKYTMQQLGLTDSQHGFYEACQWLSSRFSIPLLDGDTATCNITPKKAEPTEANQADLPLAYIPYQHVQSTITVINSLSVCINHLFGAETTKRVTDLYRLGIHRNRFHQDGTIFWSIDEQGRVHNGKVQCYCTDQRSPNFAKSYKEVPAYWLTNEMQRRGFVPEGHRLDIGGLFGAHLIGQEPEDKPIIIVESPKNAIFGAAAFPEYLWLAAGNKTALNPRVLQAIDGRSGVIYPDRDAIADWKETMHKLKELRNFEVSDFCEEFAPDAESTKYDIADYIVDECRRTFPELFE